MLTDDEIRALLARYNAMQGQYPNLATSQDGTIAELCTRLLSAEAKVKVLEEALQKIGEIAFGHQDSKFVEIYIAVRTALQEQSK
jgi:hypothetical protein